MTALSKTVAPFNLFERLGKNELQLDILREGHKAKRTKQKSCFLSCNFSLKIVQYIQSYPLLNRRNLTLKVILKPFFSL
ncbi:hypothetical protein P5673_017158 [Acropora cervicornis]|uniref:Uncharacterized protein n=1 Tax=Acropora cervicornis TaxID=6130 RepID=A0AAD9V3R0_ACRCE|nr:hypothetical protein P5673_017158 [Acropora cervicornis]